MQKGNYVQLLFCSSVLGSYSHSQGVLRRRLYHVDFVLLEVLTCSDIYSRKIVHLITFRNIWRWFGPVREHALAWRSASHMSAVRVSGWRCLIAGATVTFWRWYNRDPGVVMFGSSPQIADSSDVTTEMSQCLRPVAFAHIDVDIFPSAIEAPRGNIFH